MLSGSNTPSILYKKISITEARKNKEYAAFFENEWLERAAMLCQRRFRKQFMGNYNQRFNGPLTLRFIREPLDGIKFSEHADRIRAGEWLRLDYADPEFIRNIYKAFRLGLINANQTMTTSFWHDAINFFKNKKNITKVGQHSFEEKGPYHPEEIEYATDLQLASFAENLKTLPVTERVYLTIDLPVEHELIFLITGMEHFFIKDNESYISSKKKFEFFLHKYSLKLPNPSEEKTQLVHNLSKKESCISLIDFIIKKQLSPLYPKARMNKLGKYTLLDCGNDEVLISIAENMEMLIALFGVGEQCPFLILSPNHDENNPTSPLLSMVLPTVASLMELQSALHGKDTAFPVFTVGQFSLRNMVSILKKSENLRPIELAHPDVKHHEKPHGYFPVSPFVLTYHDLFIHLWRNGSNPYKKLFQNLIFSWLTYKKIQMSKTVYMLVDMDTSMGVNLRTAEKLKHSIRISSIQLMADFLNLKIGIKFWSMLETFDHNLLIVVDMILNREKWKESLGDYPEDFFPTYTATTNTYSSKGTTYTAINMDPNKPIFPYDFTKFQTILASMRDIISSNPKTNPFQAGLFYVIAYRFRNFQPVLDELIKLDAMGLNNFLSWSVNGGVYISHAMYSGKIYLEEISSQQLILTFQRMLIHKKFQVTTITPSSEAKKPLENKLNIPTKASATPIISHVGLGSNSSHQSLSIFSKPEQIEIMPLPTVDNLNRAIGKNIIRSVYGKIFSNEAFTLNFIADCDVTEIEIEKIIRKKFLNNTSEKITIYSSSIGVSIIIPKTLEKIFHLNMDRSLITSQQRQKRLPDLSLQTVRASERALGFFTAKTSEGVKLFKYINPAVAIDPAKQAVISNKRYKGCIMM